MKLSVYNIHGNAKELEFLSSYYDPYFDLHGLYSKKAFINHPKASKELIFFTAINMSDVVIRIFDEISGQYFDHKLFRPDIKQPMLNKHRFILKFEHTIVKIYYRNTIIKIIETKFNTSRVRGGDSDKMKFLLNDIKTFINNCIDYNVDEQTKKLLTKIELDLYDERYL